ncbi:MAG TPA: ISKra4 family transposase [Ktedonobacteraceae bacterium]|nr:ISKra4 family transposase [Ktedonobacteraceae bacterium]
MPSTALLPHAHQSLVRLCAWMPFERAVKQLQDLLGVQVSDSTARRQALAAGAVWEQIQSEQAGPRGSKDFPLPQEEPAERMLMSSDGGLVPLRGGVWAEVKTVVIGEVVCPKDKASTVRSQNHSYFSRLTDAATFADLASVEVSRRGVERAKEVCAVQDGAEWLQGFVDGHRPDAVRILDFAHAAGYLGQIEEQAQLLGYHLPKGWLRVLLHQLKHHGPKRVLSHLECLEQRWSLSSISDALRYLRKRESQMQYPQFQADGWPIGSGSVESGNKVVMQARLKGAGMRWRASNVNPMLALRNMVYNDRWSEGWQQQQQWRKQSQNRRRQQRSQLRYQHLLEQFQQQLVRLYLLLPSSKAAAPAVPKGRTEGQKRWGRQTFSPKALHLRHAKI